MQTLASCGLCGHTRFRIVRDKTDSLIQCTSCEAHHGFQEITTICRSCGTMSRVSPLGDRVACDCDDLEFHVLVDRYPLRVKSSRRNSPVPDMMPNSSLATPRDVPLHVRYGGGTYNGTRQSQPPVSQERTRFSSSVKHGLFEKCRGVCAGCLDNFRQPGNMEIDHIVPLHKGGNNNPDNLQLLCRSCNTQKGTGTMDELILKLKRAGIR